MPDLIPEIDPRARAAQAAVEPGPRRKLMRWSRQWGGRLYRREHAEACARLACDETGMGIYEDKVLKHRKKTLGTLRDLQA